MVMLVHYTDVFQQRIGSSRNAHTDVFLHGIKNWVIEVTLLVYYVTDIVGCVQGLDCAAIDVRSHEAEISWVLGSHTEQML